MIIFYKEKKVFFNLINILIVKMFERLLKKKKKWSIVFI